MKKTFKIGPRGSEPVFSGAIEEIAPGRLRGWARNNVRPSEPVALDVTLDAILIATIFAAEPRESDDGEQRPNGFSFDARLDLSQASGKLLTLHVRGRPDQAIGPVRLEGALADTWPGDTLGRIAHVFAHITATHVESAKRLQHVFDHVTATHERIIGEIKTSAHKASISAVRLSESGFLGIGHDNEHETSDATERAIFEKCIELALSARK